MDLLQELKIRQGRLSNRKFAKKLGISRQMWDFIASGKREIGGKVAWAIYNVYPDLLDPILDLMDSKIRGRKHGDSSIAKVQTTRMP